MQLILHEQCPRAQPRRCYVSRCLGHDVIASADIFACARCIPRAAPTDAEAPSSPLSSPQGKLQEDVQRSAHSFLHDKQKSPLRLPLEVTVALVGLPRRNCASFSFSFLPSAPSLALAAIYLLPCIGPPLSFFVARAGAQCEGWRAGVSWRRPDPALSAPASPVSRLGRQRRLRIHP